MTSAHNINIESCPQISEVLDIIDKLRKSEINQDIKLPNVVVIGGLDSGKNTLIETISGIKLPKNNENVVDYPLELQLRRVVDQPWKSVLNYINKNGIERNIIIMEPHKIENFILEGQAEMDQAQLDNIHRWMTLRVESPLEISPELTLIDLPGTVESEKFNMNIMNYFINSRTLIICIMAANLYNTFNNTNKVLRKFEKISYQTIVVLTQPEMVQNENKTKVITILENQKSVLNKTFFIVKCGSKCNQNKFISLQEFLEDEMNFFIKDSHYKKINSSQLGLTNLINGIQEFLHNNFKINLPKLQHTVKEKITQTDILLKNLPKEMPENHLEKQIYLIGILITMNDEMKICLENGKISFSDIKVFPEWRQHFKTYQMELDRILEKDLEQTFSIFNISILMLNSRGHEFSGFLDYELFLQLVRNHVKQFKQNAFNLLDEIANYTQLILVKMINHYFTNIHLLQKEFKVIVDQQIQLFIIKTKDRIKCIFNEEKVIFTTDEMLGNGIEKLKLKTESISYSHTPFDSDSSTHSSIHLSKRRILKSKTTAFIDSSVENFVNIIKSYLTIFHSRINSTIPMAIRRCMHFELYQELKNNFIRYVMVPTNIRELVENENVIKERINLKAKKTLLESEKSQLIELKLNFYD